MRLRDNTGGATAPNAAIVGTALANLSKPQWLRPSESTRLVYEIQGPHVKLGGYSPPDVSTALSGSVLGECVYSPDLGETCRIRPNALRSRGLSAETGFNYFEQLRARRMVDKVKEEILAWRNKLEERHMVSLNRQLEYLFEEEPELESKQFALSLNSFGVLLAYLARHPEFKAPSIGFNRDGTFSAIWTGDKKLRMTLDFLSSTSIRWIFVDSRNGIRDAITGAGIVPLDILSGVFDAYGATNWMNA